MQAVAQRSVWQHWGLLARWGAPVAVAALMGCTTTTTTTTSSTSVPQSSVVGSVSPKLADAHRRAQIRLELAASYFQAGRLDVAQDEVGQALAAKPDYADAYGLLGLILMQNKDWTNAEIALRKAVDLNPRDGNQLHNYGWMQCQQKHFDAAHQWFDKALQAPGYREQPRTLLAKGMCYQQAGQLEQAYQNMFRAYEMDVSNSAAGYNLANVLWLKGDLKRAQFYIRRLNNDSNQATAESLWLGIKIDKALQEGVGARQQADQLRQRFPQSRELLAYERGAFNE
ncbi:type IV pilus biogenesis/stability protein PilW [Comamonas sp. Y33R10-2]|uniref:type IV pilus biogenesis/stability protein PilW n=1 Tax=Comamonas sp. Y33R10-2 TaxID=2853257 RepID=UPI001C5C9DDB|nr:type IV pilus biogenesis/stability protein PilW [Comamonas sp. Y33R10-2]QXZ08338.1 type IV pilus biogenesis/stability protein PilW [Comamonas sp. Y33R10-2]